MTRSKPPLTELRDADIRRVDAVKGAANGTRFIIAKAAVGEAGLVAPDTVRDLIADAEPQGDTYLGSGGAIIKADLTADDRKDLPDSEFGFVDEQGVGHYPINDAAHVRNALSRAAAEIKAGGEAADLAQKALPRIQAAARRLGIGEPAQDMKKESAMDPTPTEDKAAPMSLEEARSILKRAKIEKKRTKLAKLAAELAKADGESPSPQADPTAPDAGNDGDADKPADVEKGTVSIKEAKAIARAAKLAKETARDQLATEKARRILAKVGRRNSGSDQAHVDAIDTHAAALGATAHQPPTPGQPGSATPTSTPDLVTKTDGDVADAQLVAGSAEDAILKAIGPVLEKDRELIDGKLSEVSQQLAKIERIALPGGPRVVLDRDGSVIVAGDGEMGMTFEQAALHKVAQTFPVGSVEREALEKAGAKSAIKDLLEARARS